MKHGHWRAHRPASMGANVPELIGIAVAYITVTVAGFWAAMEDYIAHLKDARKEGNRDD